MMNLADPELELIDPTPNVHNMFLHFDKTFFWAKLSSRCVVRWSKRMYSCAGICSYEGQGGLCDIALSEPLLKLRPRKDMVETLLHEMIHAYLFVTRKDQNRDGHGPNFQAHMHRINRAAGLNISIYHDFHDEVKLYQTHWWRCNGPCQAWKPHFGIVRRSMNRAPGKTDFWWTSHNIKCGGTFIKIKEPTKPETKGKNTAVAKTNADITKYIINNSNKENNNKLNTPISKHINNNNNKEINKNNVTNKNKINTVTTINISNNKNKFPVISNVGIKSNTNSTVLVTKKNVVFNPRVSVVSSSTGQTINDKRQRTSSASVIETVREVWANKQLGINNNKPISKNNDSTTLFKPSKNKIDRSSKSSLNTSTTILNPSKHKIDTHNESPPPKMKKIDDYFTSRATSMLKDLYGQDFNVTQSNDNQKLIAKPTMVDLVDCPVCNSKIDSREINRHLDECLNAGVIENLKGDNITSVNKNESNIGNCQRVTTNVNKTATAVPPLPVPYRKKEAIIKKTKEETVTSSSAIKQEIIDTIDTLNKEFIKDVNLKRSNTLEEIDFRKSKIERTDKICNFRKSDSFTVPDISNNIQNSPLLPSIKIEPGYSDQSIKIEPGCSKTDLASATECPCCGDKLNKSVDEHLDECLSFFDNNTTIPEEGASNSSIIETIVIDDDDDEFDESLIMNATGTMLPCPCCLEMVEQIDMNNHLDKCLS